MAINLANPVNWNNQLNRGLVGRWKLLPGGVSNRLTNLVTPGGMDGLCVNGAYRSGHSVAYASDMMGSIALDGTDDYIEVASSPRFDSATGTILFWHRNTANTDWLSLLARASSGTESGITFYQNTNGLNLQVTFTTRTSGGSTVASGTFSATPTNTWTQLALVWSQASGGPFRWFTNGVLNSSTTASNAWAFNGQVIRYGKLLDTFFGYQGGQIDDIMWFNRQLDDTEIMQWYKETQNGSPKTINRISRRAVGSVAAPAGNAGSPLLNRVMSPGHIFGGKCLC
jgi:Concanavalin A-like lectin/glucanases superfamily